MSGYTEALEDLIQIEVRGRGMNLEIVALRADGSIWVGDYGPEEKETPWPLNWRWFKLPPLPSA